MFRRSLRTTRRESKEVTAEAAQVDLAVSATFISRPHRHPYYYNLLASSAYRFTTATGTAGIRLSDTATSSICRRGTIGKRRVSGGRLANVAT